ncbi:hypothetical protein DFR31_0216 [Alkalispirillum mobile]|uniref:DUF7931 domain-containing protein n=1 Tax=Alkalispirillum mobile TaxID=85925 RepID=A0A498C518_9GAMM|nr:hypothetical protein [Alkalispirillum mobile]RLK50323.1 hypothetical protein DFR31_0216 [Alkalispirillum mobile]
MDMDEPQPGWNPVTTASEHAEVAVELVRQAQHEVDIISADLDPAVFNDQGLADALRKLAVSSPKARIRVLVEQANPLVRCDHRLLTLARKVPSRMQIRQLAPDAELPETLWLMVDGRAVMWRRHREGYRGGWHSDAAGACREWRRKFDTLWNHSVDSPELRVIAP